MRIEGPYAGNLIMPEGAVKADGSEGIKAENLSAIFTLNNDNGMLCPDDDKAFLGGDGSLEGIRDSAKALKDNLNAIFNKMDSGKAVMMDEEGVDINDTEVDEVVTVVERIQIKLAMYCDDFVPTTDISIDDLKDTVGSAALAYDIAECLSAKSYPATKENVSEVMNTLEEYSRIPELSDGTKAYMIKNGIEPTISNIYMASHSGGLDAMTRGRQLISDTDFNKIAPQVEKIIEGAGYEVNAENMANARFLVNNGIELTEKTLTDKITLDGIKTGESIPLLIDKIVATMVDGDRAGMTYLTDKMPAWQQAERAMDTLSNVTAQVVERFVATGTEDNLDNVRSVIEDDRVDDYLSESTASYNYIDEIKGAVSDEKNATYLRQLQEIRLMMTIDSGRFLVKNGMDINRTGFTELIDALKDYEASVSQQNISVSGNGIEITGQVLSVRAAYESLKITPAAVLGAFTDDSQIPTVNNMLVNTEGSNFRLSAMQRSVSLSYETMSTQVRTDLGDSLFKAVEASTGDILSDLGYDDNEANRRAVRILAYSRIDVTAEMVDKVKVLDDAVNTLFNEMTPRAVLSLIREGIDPLNTDVKKLTEYFRNKKDTRSSEKYSEFLYRMEQMGSITEEERERYIAIYGMVNRFSKEGLACLGMTAQEDLELTMGNMLKGYMTERSLDMDITADVNMGMAEVIESDRVTYYKSLFAGASNKISPEILRDMDGDSKLIDPMTPEEFAAGIEEGVLTQDGSQTHAGERTMEMIKAAAQLEPETIRLVTENQLPATYGNLLAADAVRKDSRRIFDRAANYTEENIEEAFENAEDEEDLASVYDKLSDEIIKAIGDALYTEDSYIDMEMLRGLGYEMNLMGSLARRNDYYIPYNSSHGNGVINLKILDNTENAGNFTIRFTEGELRINIEGRITDEGITAGVYTGDRTIEEGVKESMRSLAARLEEEYSDVRIFVNYSGEQAGELAANAAAGDAQAGRRSTRSIVSVAKSFVTSLANATF